MDLFRRGSGVTAMTAALVLAAALASLPDPQAKAATARVSAKTTATAPATVQARARPPVFAALVERSRREHLVVGRLRRGAASPSIFTFAEAPNSGAFGPLAVSHSGTHVAFNFADSGDWVVAVIRTDGRGYRVLAHDAPTDHLVWSPDDSTIYFNLVSVPSGSRGSRGEHVWRVPVDGTGRPKQIVNSGHAVPTGIAHDGRWLALWIHNRHTEFGRCAIIRTNGTHRRNVGPDNCGSPLWRPHAATLVTTRVIRSSRESLLTQQLWALYLRTGDYRVIPHVQPANQDGIANALAWDRSGAFLYYMRCAPHSCAHYYRIRPDGTGKRDITPEFPSRLDDLVVQQG